MRPIRYSNQDSLRESLFGILEAESLIWGDAKNSRKIVIDLVCRLVEKYRPDNSSIIAFKEMEYLDFLHWLIGFIDWQKDQFGKKLINVLTYVSSLPLKSLEFKTLETDEANAKKREIDMFVFRLCQSAFVQEPEKSLLLFVKIFDNMFSPLYFVDFIKSSFEQTSSTSIKILSLNCLLVLVGKYSFEYEGFYGILYSLVQEELQILKGTTNEESSRNLNKLSESLFSNKYTSKFLRILEVSFRSNRLSKSLTTSFIKLLLRLALTMNVKSSIWLSLLIFNLSKKLNH
jgi:hypothetical protein